MFKDLDNCISELKDSKAGWVTRRDAALQLGQVMQRAHAALQAHKNDEDVDVKSAVERALRGDVKSSEVSDEPTKKTYTLEELVTPSHKPPQRDVEKEGDGYKVEIEQPNNRSQTVYVRMSKRKDGVEMVHIYTYCGDKTPGAEKWALQSNRKLARCAFALEKSKDGERLIVVDNQVLEEATPISVKYAIKDIAHYGDWLESKLNKEDVF